MRRIVLLAALAALLGACAPSYTVRTSSDPVYGSTTVRLDLNTLGGGCIYCGSIELNIMKFTRGGSARPAYELVVDYDGSEWLFIDRGQSLTLNVDGDLMRFTSDRGSSPYRDVGYGGKVRETAYYPVTVEELRRIANASVIHVRVDGSSYYAVREFGPENFENFKRFIAEHVD